MKAINSFVLMICLFCGGMIYGQNIPVGAKYVKRYFATTYLKGDTLDHKVSENYFDSRMNNLLFSVNEQSRYAVTVIDRPEKHVSAEVTREGDTLSYSIYLYDTVARKRYHHQVIDGDTVISQIWKQDKMGNDIELYNKENGVYYLDNRTAYDEKGNMILSEWFNQQGVVKKTQKCDQDYERRITTCYESIETGSFMLYSKVEKIDSLTTKCEIFKDSEGYNYGILLKYHAKGYIIDETSPDGEWKGMKIYDSKNELTCSIRVVVENL